MICLTETWASDDTGICFETNSNFLIPHYTAIHQTRQVSKRRGGVCIFVHDSLVFKKREDLSCSCSDNENLTIELSNKNSKTTIINLTYRPPSGNVNSFYDFLKHFFNVTQRERKIFYFVGDFNLDSLNSVCHFCRVQGVQVVQGAVFF